MRSSQKSGGLKFLTILAFVVAACAAAFAENNEKGSEKPAVLGTPDGGSGLIAKKAALTMLEQRMQKTITIDVNNLSIDTVLRQLADQADVDFIKSPKVTGDVTATLTDVPLEEALSNILAAHDYGYVMDKNMIRIAPIAEIAQKAESLTSRIYRITYADVKEVASALDKFKSPQGVVSFNKSTSNIIVTDTESRIRAIDTFIDEIDRITPQILVEVKIYDITTDEDFCLDIPWDAARNTPITTTSITDILKLDKTINNITGATTTDTTITDYDATETTATVWRDDGTSYRKSKPFIGGSFDQTEGGSIRFGLLNDVVDIEFVLSVLHEQDFAKLLANPRIMVLDNETAKFEIIREIPYTEQTSTASITTQTVKYKEVGVKLEVTPHVTRNGMLRLHIIPEFGVRVGSTSPPTVNTRKVDTIALVKDGQTVVLGGLRKRETTQDIWKVPIFGDIPLLGGLFHSQTESVETNELVIFITPKIVVESTLSPRELEQLEDSEVPSTKKPTLILD